MGEGLSPEQLWARAHEHVTRGDFANGVRDLAQCFELLQANNDARFYEVHKRWTEVHGMYLQAAARELEQQKHAAERTAAATAPLATQATRLVPGLASAAHAALGAVDDGEGGEGLRMAESACGGQPLRAGGTAPASAPAAPAAAHDDGSNVNIDSGPMAASPAPPATAPAMAVDDAPVGMQSLDVPFSVGDSIDSAEAADLSVDPDATNAAQVAGDVAFLEELLGRVQANRRSPSAGA
jgi:hypothetical protein